MGDFIYAASWAQHSRSSLQHFRSNSSNTVKSSPPKALPPRPVPKATSTSALHTMSTSGAHRLSLYNDEDRDMSTIPDPRSRAMTPTNDPNTSSPSQHPDLSNEVALLSNKLINAINHQTNLDDTLSATRQELAAAREQIKTLEHQNSEHTEMVSRGILIRKSISDNEKTKLVASIMDERRQKNEIAQQKKAIEQELENLSVALFEEAQNMVITAREEAQKDHDAVQKRNDQLKAQLADTEGLLKFQQEQLAELKRVMEQMDGEKDDQTNPTAPSTPGLAKFDSKEDTQDADTIQTTLVPEAASPTYPTSFTHLLHTVLRTDLTSFEDFTSLLKMSKNIPSSSRVSSGSYGTIGLGLGLGGYAPTAPANGSTTSLSTNGTHGSVPATPTAPASTSSTGSATGPNSLTPLKETKFFKRALAEDIEPTLRLDAAPGLSWLARRTVLNAVFEGTMVVEPMSASNKLYTYACSLCGESRKDTSHTRSHRFRTSENENAQRYPLCRYCLGRVRSTCDFLGFLRILKDGHWRADDEESEKAAWEESVRLREQMFWCRIGGGVVLANNHVDSRSSRFSEDEKKEQERKLNEEERKLSEELERTGEIQPRDVTLDVSKRDSVRSLEKSPIKSAVAEIQQSEVQQSKVEQADVEQADAEASVSAEILPAVVTVSTEKQPRTTDEPSERPREITGNSIQSTYSLKVLDLSEAVKEDPKRLSITIPGAFE